MRYLVVLLVATAVPAWAQPETPAEAPDGDASCTVDLSFDPLAADSAAAPVAAPAGAALTEAETQVQAIIAQRGVHVVHFWAPWCGNSVAELRDGWSDLVVANDGVTFTFVTIWNDGQSGAETLAAYDLPARVLELTQSDFGPSSDKAQRRRQFLGLPVTWVPSTWIFRNNGELAFALNYGEMGMGTLQTLIDAAHNEWAY